MRQFSQRDLLLNKAVAGALTAKNIDQLADCIARFHAGIPRADESTAFGGAETVRQPVLENFQQIKQLTGCRYENERQQLESWCHRQYAELTSFFRQRKNEGFIRECHGDLHLGNIVFFDRQVIPFDGIEFNESLRWIDIISEVAFLLMDLDHHQYPDLAFRFLNCWLTQTGDYSGLKLLRYYLVYRAMVRAKVVSIRQKQQQTLSKTQTADEIGQYLQLGLSYIQQPAPKLIICHGLSGSGKTTVSQALLEAIQAIRIRSDVERKRLFGIAPDGGSGSEIQGGIYTDDISEKVYQHLHDIARTILNAGFTVIVDATFLKQGQRSLFKTLASAMHVPYYIIHCHADPAILRQRIISRKQAERDASEADLNVLEHQLQHQQGLTEEEQQRRIDLNTGSDWDLSWLKKLLNG